MSTRTLVSLRSTDLSLGASTWGGWSRENARALFQRRSRLGDDIPNCAVALLNTMIYVNLFFNSRTPTDVECRYHSRAARH